MKKLLVEDITENRITVTSNTVIVAFNQVVSQIKKQGQFTSTTYK